MNSRVVLLALLASIVAMGSAMALDLPVYGNDLTISDNIGNNAGSGDGIFARGDAVNEDDEVEPDMRAWDLEGFFTNQAQDGAGNLIYSDLSMIGQYDFRDGEDFYGTQIRSGDLFIDVGGNAIYGEDVPTFKNINPGVTDVDAPTLLGWEYVLDIDWDSATGSAIDFDLVKLDNAHRYEDVIFWQNDPESDPWRVVRHDRETVLYSTTDQQHEAADFQAGIGDLAPFGNMASSGTERYAVTFNWKEVFDAINADLASENKEYTNGLLHFTMECGNDLLMGDYDKSKAPPVPEPASIALLGLGILGVAMRKRFTA